MLRTGTAFLLTLIFCYSCAKSAKKIPYPELPKDRSIQGYLFGHRHVKFMQEGNQRNSRAINGYCGKFNGTYKFCDYKDPASGTDVTYWLCLEGKAAPCPDTIPEVVSAFQVYNFKADDEFFACTTCRSMGVYCDRDADCCQTYPSDRPNGQGTVLPSIFPAHCYKDKKFRGKCRPCIQLHASCGNGKLSCCDQQDRPLTSVVSCNRQNPSTDSIPTPYKTCAVKACNPKAQEEFQYFNRSCYSYATGNKTLPSTYYGRNFCACPKDELTGYKCVYKDCPDHGTCVSCFLEGHACTDAKECCDWHVCQGPAGKKQCRRMTCITQGRPCKDKNSKCCEADQTCQQGFFGIVCSKYKCKQLGDFCGNDPDCCGTNVCRNMVVDFGTCVKKDYCVKLGERCGTSIDCCGKKVRCQGRDALKYGTCKPCYDLGERCRNDLECCEDPNEGRACLGKKDMMVNGKIEKIGKCAVSCETQNSGCLSTKNCCKPLLCKDDEGEILKPQFNADGEKRVGNCVPKT